MKIGKLTAEEWATMAKRHNEAMLKLIEAGSFLEALIINNEIICCLANAEKTRQESLTPNV